MSFSPYPSLSALFLSPPALSLFPFRPHPILSPPPSALTLSIYLYPHHLPHSSPSAPLFPFRPQPILSPPPSTLTLSIYICLYPYPLSHQPRSSLPYPAYSLSPPPSDERDEGYPILLMGRRGGAGDSHIPLTPPRGGGRARGEIGIKYPRRRTHSGVRRLGSTSGEE